MIKARGRQSMWQFVLQQRDIRRNVRDGRRYERVNIAFLRLQLRIAIKKKTRALPTFFTACNLKQYYFFVWPNIILYFSKGEVYVTVEHDSLPV
jgi:hypothetical protein